MLEQDSERLQQSPRFQALLDKFAPATKAAEICTTRMHIPRRPPSCYRAVDSASSFTCLRITLRISPEKGPTILQYKRNLHNAS